MSIFNQLPKWLYFVSPLRLFSVVQSHMLIQHIQLLKLVDNMVFPCKCSMGTSSLLNLVLYSHSSMWTEIRSMEVQTNIVYSKRSDFSMYDKIETLEKCENVITLQVASASVKGLRTAYCLKFSSVTHIFQVSAT